MAFVGRASELRELTAALDRAETGAGGLVVLTGEAGIGKSRLASEVAALASGRGFGIVTAWAWDGAGAPPFWLWTQALEPLGVRWDVAPGTDRFELFED